MNKITKEIATTASETESPLSRQSRLYSGNAQREAVCVPTVVSSIRRSPRSAESSCQRTLYSPIVTPATGKNPIWRIFKK